MILKVGDHSKIIYIPEGLEWLAASGCLISPATFCILAVINLKLTNTINLKASQLGPSSRFWTNIPWVWGREKNECSGPES